MSHANRFPSTPCFCNGGRRCAKKFEQNGCSVLYKCCRPRTASKAAVRCAGAGRRLLARITVRSCTQPSLFRKFRAPNSKTCSTGQPKALNPEHPGRNNLKTLRACPLASTGPRELEFFTGPSICVRERTRPPTQKQHCHLLGIGEKVSVALWPG